MKKSRVVRQNDQAKDQGKQMQDIVFEEKQSPRRKMRMHYTSRTGGR